MTDTREPHDAQGPSVVIDLDDVRAARPASPTRTSRLVDLQAQDVGRSVRVQALERLGRR